MSRNAVTMAFPNTRLDSNSPRMMRQKLQVLIEALTIDMISMGVANLQQLVDSSLGWLRTPLG
jgi:hypothetical protein